MSEWTMPTVCFAVVVGFLASVVFIPAKAGEVGAVLAFAAWGIAIIVVLVEQRRLYRYLKREHYDKWAELTSGPFWGPGGANSARGLRFLFGKNELEDTEVANRRQHLRRAIWWIPVVLFLAVSIVVVGSFIASGYSKGL